MLPSKDVDAHIGQITGTDGAPNPPLQQTRECIGAELFANCLSSVRLSEDGVTIDYNYLVSRAGMDRAQVRKMLEEAVSGAKQEEEAPGPIVDQPAPPAEDGQDPFDFTMQSLVFPANLEEYYPEIYVGFQKCISHIIVPEKRETIQRALDKVSALLDDGSVDARGPVGLLIHILRQWSAVPDRVVSAENRS